MRHRKLKNSELTRKSVKGFKDAPKLPLTIILDNIRSAHNIGSVFRSADAFLIKKIYLCGVCAVPPNKNIRKTALGATETVEWAYEDNTLSLIKQLKAEGKQVLAIEQAEEAVMLDKFSPQPSQDYVVVFGNEIKGVQQKVVSESDYVVEIPQLGNKHSLNIAVSAGVVCWDLYTKMK